MKQLFEFFPLIVFFAVYYKSDKDLYLSIAAVIIATLISLVALYIKEKKVFYNHFADKSDSNKLNYDAKLQNLEMKELPKYLYSNKDKYKEWIDLKLIDEMKGWCLLHGNLNS